MRIRSSCERLGRVRETRLGFDMDAGLDITRYNEDAGFEEDLQTWEFRVPLWRAGRNKHAEAMEMAECLIADRWGLYWHLLRKLLDKTKYADVDVEKLRMRARTDMDEEEGK